MDLKILIACLVFCLTWRITTSQQVSESKAPRMKTIQESNIDEMKKQSSLANHQNRRNKNFIELGQPDLGPINFMNINPEKRKQSKIFRIKPAIPNPRKPFKFPVQNQDDQNFSNEKLNEANVTNNEPKDQKVTNGSSVVSTDESTPVKGTDSQLGNILIKKSNGRIPFNNTSPSKPAFFIELPTIKSEIAKPLVTEQKLESKEKPNPDIKQEDIHIDTAYVTDEAIYNRTEFINTGRSEFYPIHNDDDKGKPKKHPFLDAIQNDRYLMCSPQDAPNASVIADTTSIEDIELRFRDDRLSKNVKAPDQTVDKIMTHSDTKDEVEDVSIKKFACEEISEKSNIPQVPLNPEFDANNVPVPYQYNQLLKSINLHNQLDPRTPDEQRIEKKDEKHVYIYNNYYQRPNEYWYGNKYQKPFIQNYQDGYCSYYQPTTYNANCGNNAPQAIPGIQNYWNKVYDTNKDDYRNRNAYYGYNRAQPQQMQNYWYRDYDTNRNINEKIHRKWINTEYNIKGKNAFKQFSDDNLRNKFVQNGPLQNAGGFI